VDEYRPELAIGTTPVVQHAKERGIPGLYFTNLIAARPLMGPAGAGSLAQVINGALASRPHFDTMREFFAGVGSGYAAGIWPDQPRRPPEPRRPRARARKNGDGPPPASGEHP
jgi:chlorophyllide a reductase subunit Y